MSCVRIASASSEVAAPIGDVFAFLADLRNHWRLTGDWIDVAELTPQGAAATGATVRLRGPLRSAIAVRTTVEAVEEPLSIRGRGVAGGSRADVAWTFTAEAPGVTHVTVEVVLRRASFAHGVLWLLGGRAWLARRLAVTVRGLEPHLCAHAAGSAGGRVRVAAEPARS